MSRFPVSYVIRRLQHKGRAQATPCHCRPSAGGIEGGVWELECRGLKMVLRERLQSLLKLGANLDRRLNWHQRETYAREVVLEEKRVEESEKREEGKKGGGPWRLRRRSRRSFGRWCAAGHRITNSACCSTCPSETARSFVHSHLPEEALGCSHPLAFPISFHSFLISSIEYVCVVFGIPLHEA